MSIGRRLPGAGLRLGLYLAVFVGIYFGVALAVFGVALYRFANQGEVTGGFTAAELESAVRER